ncbi:putative alpha/beta-hydrolase family hydrolase [Paenibacillus shirakamiensis]|uniref:Alpha/beta-hydrolase family hydrolase n=1 Tax=Paenibacillus shirakamiensis TaxID=1265935 RepID=A0ABS4JIC8_9BACL|nr:alpha/beta hydrolase [Paenibacillus shirakamiensis]MBP2001468.1 putative alpha/beta-hydrolase family hydrolase [Paenibacillus shirakamiensis]
MKIRDITLSSKWGTEIRQKLYQLDGESKSLVVLFPGKYFSCDRSPLYYAGVAARQQGMDVLKLEYGYQVARVELDLKDLPDVIEECMEAIQAVAEAYNNLIFVSKSLGTLIAGEIECRIQMTIHNIYLTPLHATLPYINDAKGMIIYGTQDPEFESVSVDAIIPSAERRVIAIEGADHALERETVQGSLDVLQFLVTTYTEFYETVLNRPS